MFTMGELEQQVKSCRRCKLCQSRTNVVFGEGSTDTALMFVGEAPGADEDRFGKPFVGKAGQLLDKGLKALDLGRNKNFYIANICKCRPENNRTPMEDEAEACLPYLLGCYGCKIYYR